MIDSSYQTHFPVATLSEGAPIEFNVTASPEDYIDLGRKDTANREAIEATQPMTTVNLLHSSLFQQVDVKLNDRLVTPSLNTYAYKAYMETLLSHGPDAKESWLSAAGWYGQAGDDPTVSNPHLDNDAAPLGVRQRGEMIAAGRDFQLSGRPSAAIFQQERYLVPGVNMHLKFIPSGRAFHLHYDSTVDDAGGNPQGHFVVVIKRAELRVRRVQINPDVQLQQLRDMENGKNALYPVRRGVVTTFTVGTGSQSFVQENVTQGQLPRRLFVAMVTNAAYNGDAASNPFRFQHFGLNYLTASALGKTYPSAPYKPDYGGRRYLACYTDLQRTLGSVNTNRGNGISYKDYLDGGHVVYGFDFTPDMSEGPHRDPPKSGSLRLEGHFDNALTAAINVIVYAEYDNLIQIDRARNVVADFAAS